MDSETNMVIGNNNMTSTKISMVDTQYSRYIEELWKISNEMENILDPMLIGSGSGISEDKPQPETRLLSDLEKLVERFKDLKDRIRI